MKLLLDKMNSVTAYIATISFVLILLITSIDVNCFDKNFYNKEYQALNTAQELGMTEDDLQKATNTLLDYLQDKRDDIETTISIKGSEQPAFNAKEASHMVDVRDLYHFAMVTRNVCIVLFAISIVYLFVRLKKGALTILSINYMKASILIAVFFIMLAGWAYVDFNAFWTTFHHIAFRNELWLLDPNVDLMINLFPAAFFSHLLFRIIAIFASCFLGIFIICYLYLRARLKRMHEELLYDEE